MSTQTPTQGHDTGLPDETEDLILVHYRAWIAARTVWYELSDLPGNGNWDTPEIKAFEQAERAARAAMLATPAQTNAGLAALVHIAWDADGPVVVPSHPDYEAQMQDDERQPLLALWRSLTGQERPPVRPGVDFQVRKQDTL